MAINQTPNGKNSVVKSVAQNPSQKNSADSRNKLDLKEATEPVGPAQWFSTSLAIGFLTGFIFATAYFFSEAKKQIAKSAQISPEERSPRTPTSDSTVISGNSGALDIVPQKKETKPEIEASRAN